MRMTSFKRVLATGVFLSSALIATGAMAQADLDKAIANPGEWAAPGRTFDLQRYSPSTRSTPAMSASSRWHGRSPPACCAAMKARRW